MALMIALHKLGVKPLTTVAAVSVGMKDGQVLADLDYNEDSRCDVDMNLVMAGDRFVEVQGTAEGAAFSKTELDAMTDAGITAIRQIREAQVAALKKLGIEVAR